jgi:hypothetical protein
MFTFSDALFVRNRIKLASDRHVLLFGLDVNELRAQLATE